MLYKFAQQDKNRQPLFCWADGMDMVSDRLIDTATLASAIWIIPQATQSKSQAHCNRAVNTYTWPVWQVAGRRLSGQQAANISILLSGGRLSQ
jgi:hypothetical protein